MQNLKKNWFVISKTARIWWILIWALKILKISNLLGCFCAECITFDLKKYGEVIFHDIEDWCKIWRKTDLCFGKWHDEYGKFSPEHLKVLKLIFWWDPFIQNWKCISINFTEEICVMTMRNDARFEEELTCRFKIDMRN